MASSARWRRSGGCGRCGALFLFPSSHGTRGTDGALARADRDRPTDGERRRAGRWPAEESRSIRQESRHRSPRTEGRAEAASAAASEGDVKGGYERRRSEDEGRTRPE